MNFKKLVFFATTALSLGVVTTEAVAYSYTFTNNSFSTLAGASTIDFGVGTLGQTPIAGANAMGDVVKAGSVGGVGYQFIDGALYNLATSPLAGTTARPLGSVDNFWSVGKSPLIQRGPGTVNFSTGLEYVGFLWGSVDSTNKVSFYSGGNKIASLTGNDVANGSFGTVNKYMNFFSTSNLAITKVIFEAGTNSFETDNFAVSAVPEVETYAMMLAGLGLMGTIARRRNKYKTT
jgi:hypothetical protein